MIELIKLSSLEKVLPDSNYSCKEINNIAVFENERSSFQIAYKDDDFCKYKFTIKSSGKLNIIIYDVMNIPIGMATNSYSMNDPNYITHSSGLMPDWLHKNNDNTVSAGSYYKSLWFEIGEIGKAGDYSFTVDFYKYLINTATDADDAIIKSVTFSIRVLPAALPKQKLIFTQWFHTDCISEFYSVDSLSRKHWTLVESFLKEARHGGINLIYTPIFTPPLDTSIGGERPTVQLVKISYQNGIYDFDFSELHHFIQLAKSVGFEYFEMPHLFTQWGAEFTPKIIVTCDGKQERFFGWHVSASDPSYEDFLSQFLPMLIEELKSDGVLENTYFHISDEPNENNLKTYLSAKSIAQKYLKGLKIVDAASHYELFEYGLFPEPIVSTGHIKQYLNKNIKNLWAYYCCCETTGYSNRLMSMPSCRTRFLAYQLFKYNIKGFLQWGFNFYYSQGSTRLINPFVETDAGCAFPSGDPFSVYPGRNGAEPSLRLIVFYESLQDLRAMELLADYIGRQKVIEIIEETCGEKIVFDHCAENSDTILRLRERINCEIMKQINKTGTII